MDHAALAKRVKEVALLEGDFTLRSGKKSKFYFDKYLFETQPDILEAMGKEIANRLPPGTTRIAGPELGARRGSPPPQASHPACRSSSCAPPRRTTAPRKPLKANSRKATRSSSSKTSSRLGAR